ncbi:(2Fe-2S)-binding protein [Notoacmeibacter ruber]|uniref:(2Fe-2S)-binding protein n=1 Tax=Notoacmeibacter ruber TaxID=2670375 RepID=UPI0024799921|nr:(2Fe-2S)-binding protein [Notoacmeibacter ruber]
MDFTINGQTVELDVDPEMPLLWALRDVLGLTGTKFGCGIAQCGVCTVIVDGMARRSCVTPIGPIEGAEITTIEGLAIDGKPHPVQQAWIDEQVPQCGYCQSGQIMSAVALLTEIPQPDEEQIAGAMTGNYCRCGTYPAIRAAILRASGQALSPVIDDAEDEPVRG